MRTRSEPKILRLSIFGRFRAADALGNEIPIKSKKARALLAYLALPPGKERSREEVMALLWSNRGDEQARSSLRQALSGLRKELGDIAEGVLKVTDEWLAFDPGVVVVEPASPGDVLLAGLHINDPAFDEWLRDERLRHEDVAAPDTHTPEMPPPDKPSIAVLPFVNLSDDPEQEYFSDGITGDIITELSRFHSLFVIARNSSFVFKNTAIDMREVASQLGVRYVLEGSVRKAANRIRVTAQLVEATTGSHIWAERYDRDLEEDEVTRNIVATLVGRLEDAGAEQAGRKPTDDLMAYDYILRGGQQLNLFTAEGIEKGTELFEKAIELDPQCARAYAGLGLAYQLRIWIFGTFEDDLVQLAHDNAQKALSLDASDSLAHAILCDLYLNSGRHDRAGDHIEKAITLNPNDSFAAWEMVLYLAYTGRSEEAIEWAQKAVRQNPYHPDWYLEFLGDAYYMAKRYDEAIETFERRNNRPSYFNAELAACYAQLGGMDEAQAAVAEYERQCPEDYNFGEFAAAHIKMCARQEDRDHWLEGYRKAGLEP
jgi:adenylate cyclase